MTAVDDVARARIESHVDHCAERWEITQKAIDGLYKRWLHLLWWIVGSQAAVIGLLFKLLLLNGEA